MLVVLRCFDFVLHCSLCWTRVVLCGVIVSLVLALFVLVWRVLRWCRVFRCVLLCVACFVVFLVFCVVFGFLHCVYSCGVFCVF